MRHAGDPGSPCTAAGHDRAPIRRPICQEGFAVARTPSQAKPRPEPSPDDRDQPSPARSAQSSATERFPGDGAAASRAPNHLAPFDPCGRPGLDPAHRFAQSLRILIRRSMRVDTPSGLALFLKRPSVFPFSTHGPELVKNISTWVLFLTF